MRKRSAGRRKLKVDRRKRRGEEAKTRSYIEKKCFGVDKEVLRKLSLGGRVDEKELIRNR